MRRILWLLLLLWCCPAWAGVTFVQKQPTAQALFTWTSGSTISVATATTNITAGNLIGVSCSYDPAGTITSVTDDNSQTYALAKTSAAGATIRQSIYYFANTVASPHALPTITVNVSGITYGWCAFFEFAGAATASNAAALGNTNSNKCDSACGASPIAMSSGIVAASAGSAVVIWGQTDNGTISINSPWTEPDIPQLNGTIIAYQANVSAGNFNGDMSDTGTANDDWSMVAVEFKVPGAAGTPALTVLPKTTILPHTTVF